ncbi:sulfotransferase family protein [Paraburkholderia unamae]|uniref:Sulfotransferase family protein n=1 Tax=Paraburkholderia unamae TaxID=219649 RepID=A0ABX5KDX5_9BURK|nr:sulfotransferase [Paraburkholderia unamae]PVX75660.1 sulfotransferase family protein [Paraburkholderia unamae]
MSDNNYRVKSWTPPPRPEWVQRINEEGRHLDLRGIIPLDADSLISHAKRNTGLDDFGGDDWLEPFQIYVRSLDEEADLNLMGRILSRSDLLMYLELRLRVEALYQQHSEIDDVVLAPPVLVTGSGRSGTSALQNLMALDPDNGTPTHWEALFPCPAPEAASYRSDPRIDLAHARMTQWNRVTPELTSIHEFGGAMPTELIQLEAASFQSPAWMIFCGFTPSYDQYIYARPSHKPAFDYARRVLKVLQWKNPRKRWLLKSPDALRVLPDFFAAFPNAQLLWIHRDPVKTMSSVTSLIGTIIWTRSDRPMPEQAVAQLTNPRGLAGLFDKVIDEIESGAIPRERVHHMQYGDFIADPVGQVERAYGQMGIDLSDTARNAMHAYLEANPRESRPAHKYNVDAQGHLSEERELFKRYHTYFDVKTEA